MKQIWVFLVCASAVLQVMADIGEPDNAGTNATTLVVTTNVVSDGPHTLSTNDLSDWFSFELEAGKRYRFESTGPSDVQATIYDDNTGTNAVVVSDDDLGESWNFQVIFVPTDTQTYYMKVESNDTGDSEYSLEYREEAFLDQWDPADNEYTNAPTLTPTESEQVHGEHNFSSNDEWDWFHFYLLAGVEYTFRAVNGGWSTAGDLYHNDDDWHNIVASGEYTSSDVDNEWNFIITYTPSESGDYYLFVSCIPAGENINYSLIYSRGPIPYTDTDGDGMSDADEAIAGTNPNDPNSYFAITNWSVGSFHISWPGYPNRVYQVYWTDNLTNGFEAVGPPIVGPQNFYNDTVHSTNNSGFYKVDVELLP